MIDKGLEGLLWDWRERERHAGCKGEASVYPFLAHEAQSFVDRLKELEKRMNDERTPERHIRALANIIHGSEQERER